MGTTRRRVLRMIGGGVVVAAGGAGAFVATRSPERALEPWNRAGEGYDDPRLEALSWAILAPNPHNRQPWLVRLDGDDGFTLFADPGRKLPHTDPFDRQITIGLGCFLEVARQAAAERGYRLRVEAFPGGEPAPTLDASPVARVVLASGGTPDPLFRAVPARRSCKEPFDMARAVSSEEMAALSATVVEGVVAGASAVPAEVAALREVAWRAHGIESATAHTHQESVDLMRFGRAAIERNPDGIDMGGPFLEALNLAGMLDAEQLSDPTSSAYRQGIEMFRELFEATPAFVWLLTKGNTRRDQLAAGASWVRLNLQAAASGLALHPVSQALQEYPEMSGPLAELHAMLGASGSERVQMLGRLGHGPATAPSPRWPLESRLV